MTDDDILAAVGDGTKTHRIVARLQPHPRATKDHVYRRLRKLEAAGKVYRHPRFSASNSIYWKRTRPGVETT